MKQLNVKSHLSTAFHPQTDGQTERVNQVLEQYLRIYTNYKQDDWSSLLPLAEFSYNNMKHSTTKISPFVANYGFHPTVHFLPGIQPSQSPSAAITVDELKKLHEELKSEIVLAQRVQAEYYDRRHGPTPEFQPGDMVYLRRYNIHTTRPSSKLDFKHLGPFPIECKISSHAYKLTLPSSMRVHPVFHVWLLSPASAPGLPDIPGHTQPPPPSFVVDEHDEYEVEAVLDSKMVRNQLYYLVKWKGYSPADNTWELAKYITHAEQALDDFHRRHPGLPGSGSRIDTRRARAELARRDGGTVKSQGLN